MTLEAKMKYGLQFPTCNHKLTYKNTQTCLVLQMCDAFHITGKLNFKPVLHGHKLISPEKLKNDRQMQKERSHM